MFSYLTRGNGICFIGSLFTHVLARQAGTQSGSFARRGVLGNTTEVRGEPPARGKGAPRLVCTNTLLLKASVQRELGSIWFCHTVLPHNFDPQSWQDKNIGLWTCRNRNIGLGQKLKHHLYSVKASVKENSAVPASVTLVFPTTWPSVMARQNYWFVGMQK